MLTRAGCEWRALPLSTNRLRPISTGVGRVSSVPGTRTHIPTADTRILLGGTAYQTDVGMTGPYDSVIGSEKNLAIRRFITGMPIRLERKKRSAKLNAVVVRADEATGKATAIRRYTVS